MGTKIAASSNCYLICLYPIDFNMQPIPLQLERWRVYLKSCPFNLSGMRGGGWINDPLSTGCCTSTATSFWRSISPCNLPFLYAINPMLYPHGCNSGFAGGLITAWSTESGWPGDFAANLIHKISIRIYSRTYFPFKRVLPFWVMNSWVINRSWIALCSVIFCRFGVHVGCPCWL